MISRQWRCLARREEAQNYIEHLRSQTFPALRKLTGFVDASILTREARTGVEFLVVTRWESLAAIRQFAGADLELAVVPDAVGLMMLDYERRVCHFEVIE